MEWNCTDCGILLTKQEIHSTRNKFNFPIEVLTGKVHDIHYRKAKQEKEKIEKKKEFKQIKFPRVKVSVILCPEPDCNFPCVETDPEKPLIDIFVGHMKREHEINVTDFCYQHVKGKIDFIRNNPKIHYQDPFMYVSHEELRKTSWVS
jgi:hypothetical protein